MTIPLLYSRLPKSRAQFISFVKKIFFFLFFFFFTLFLFFYFLFIILHIKIIFYFARNPTISPSTPRDNVFKLKRHSFDYYIIIICSFLRYKSLFKEFQLTKVLYRSISKPVFQTNEK